MVMVYTLQRKRIPPGSSARSKSLLEIDLTGKDLTDDGFDQVVNSILECINYRDEENPEGAARIAALHIANNQLTVRSLEKLGRVVALSAGDLRELDISRNRIDPTTPEHTDALQIFFESFRGCYLLKKLDLGYNQLGPVGLEILARVYMQSPVDYSATGGEVNGKADGDCSDKGDQKRALSSVNHHSKDQQQEDKKNAALDRKSHSRSKSKLSQADVEHYSCTRGLRSIPFLIVAELALSKSGAVHIASMIEARLPAHELLAFLPPGKTPSLPPEIDTCGGLVWLPNQNLGPSEHKMLEMAVQTSRRKFAELPATRYRASNDDNSEADIDGDFPGSSSSNTVALGQQRTKSNAEYGQICKRVRLEAIAAEGVHSCQLWSAALRMKVVSRALLLEDRDRDRGVGSGSMDHGKSDNGPSLDGESIDASNNEGSGYYMHVVEKFLRQLRLRHNSLAETEPERQNFRQPDHACHDHGHENVNDDMFATAATIRDTDITGSTRSRAPRETSPVVTPDMMRAGKLGAKENLGWARRQGEQEYISDHLSSAGSSHEVQSEADASSSYSSPPIKCKKPSFSAQCQKHSSDSGIAGSYHASSGKNRPRAPTLTAAKKQDWLHGLPFELWRRILACAIDSHGTLDSDQQSLIMRYGTDWDVIAYEQAIRGARESDKIWKFLDMVNCFTYSLVEVSDGVF